MRAVLQMRLMTWSEVVRRLVLVQATTRLCNARDLTEADIVGRIMRKENYLIGMLNRWGPLGSVAVWYCVSDCTQHCRGTCGLQNVHAV